MKRWLIPFTLCALLTAYGVSQAQFKAPDQRGRNGVSRFLSTTVATTVSAATSFSTAPGYLITNQDITMAASATLTLTVPAYANQMELLKVCQNGTGGFTPTFAAGTGLTITGTFPTCTTTLNKCCDVGLYFDTPTTAYVTGSNAGPL